ncbi:uncharacterized protein LOC109821391 [Asparagus officinalis]|uniref:uncharacterized protein LOC109821391 n=1 Tax=Asparagus officinalis TaxID=4686 RepID=UPI00098E2B9C|nr:uncharacterized protein LOC109821391 [Asparagus officinalis]
MALFTPGDAEQQTGRVYVVVPRDHGTTEAVVEESVCRRCIISLDDSEFAIDLIVLHMFEFDMILGMDKLSSYHVSIDCFAKTVSLRAYDGSELVVATSGDNQFAESFLAYVEEVILWDRSADLSEMRVVSDYQDVFQDIPGLPPVREVEFCIEL